MFEKHSAFEEYISDKFKKLCNIPGAAGPNFPSASQSNWQVHRSRVPRLLVFARSRSLQGPAM